MSLALGMTEIFFALAARTWSSAALIAIALRSQRGRVRGGGAVSDMALKGDPSPHAGRRADGSLSVRRLMPARNHHRSAGKAVRADHIESLGSRKLAGSCLGAANGIEVN